MNFTLFVFGRQKVTISIRWNKFINVFRIRDRRFAFVLNKGYENAGGGFFFCQPTKQPNG